MRHTLLQVGATWHQASYTISICVLFLFTSTNLDGQNFEYVLSQKEFVGSKINDITVVGDRVILVGGGTINCHTPTFWVLDTNGQFLYQESLPINYEYGEITQIAFDSSQGIFHLLGFTAPAYDVGGPSIFAWQLDQNLMLINEHDFIDTSWHDLVHFADESFLISFTDGEKLHLYGADYKQINTIDIPKYLYQRTIGRNIDRTFLLYVENPSQNTVQLLDWDGIIMDSIEIAPFDKLVTMQSSFFTVGVDHVIRKYNALDLSLKDSLAFENVNGMDIRTTSSNLIEVISYQEDEATITYLLDADLRKVYNFEHLASERQLKGFLFNGSYYHGGFDSNDELSYAKKTSIADRMFNRPHISIVDASITSPVTPTSTTILGTETVYQFHGTREALFFDLTFKNTSDSIITSFAFHTDIVYSFNCLRENVSRFIDGITLAPGETITISDSTFLHNQIARSDGFSFYVTAPNHWLSAENLSSYTVDVTTGFFNRNQSPTLINAFPNPVRKTLTILNDGIPHNANYRIYASDGKRIATGNLIDKSIPVFDLPPGFYGLQIIAKNQVHTSSFIKE